MNIVTKRIEDLKPYENNPRRNDDAVEYVKKSIQEFGFKVPIVITSDGEIVTGHTRYKACKELGIEEIPCVIADDLTEKQIKAFRLADNKTSDYSFWDNSKLLIELEDLDDIFTGFNTSEIFGEELNEKDNTFLEDIITELGSIDYKITYKCRSEEEYNEIMNFIEGIKRKYE